MNRSYGLIAFFALMVGGIAVTHALTTVPLPEGLTCESERVTAYGWTDKRRSMAELAAITKWQAEAEEQVPGAGNWHQAQRRSLNCRAYKDSAHFQCVVSAKPCKFEKRSAKAPPRK